MKPDDFRSLSIEEIDARIAEMRKQLFNYRMQLHSNQLADTNKLKQTRRDLARALTVKHEKNLQVGK
jgi:large subunit ribosomal protein L29